MASLPTSVGRATGWVPPVLLAVVVPGFFSGMEMVKIIHSSRWRCIGVGGSRPALGVRWVHPLRWTLAKLSPYFGHKYSPAWPPRVPSICSPAAEGGAEPPTPPKPSQAPSITSPSCGDGAKPPCSPPSPTHRGTSAHLLPTNEASRLTKPSPWRAWQAGETPRSAELNQTHLLE